MYAQRAEPAVLQGLDGANGLARDRCDLFVVQALQVLQDNDLTLLLC
jgi:hypothetical protein